MLEGLLNHKRKMILLPVSAAFGFMFWAVGTSSPVGVITISSASLIFAAVMIFLERLEGNKAPIPRAFLEMPVVIASLVYFCIGLMTGFFAADKFLFFKEVVQRSILIWLPTYVFAFGPRRPEDLKAALYLVLPLQGLVSLVAVYSAKSVGFAKPVYVLGMHKNQIAGTSAIACVIAIACIMSTTNKKRRLIAIGFLCLNLLGCIASQGRAALVCIVISTFFMLIARRAKIKQLSYVIVSLAVIGFTMMHFLPKEAIQHAVDTKKFSSNQIRVTLYTEIWPILSSEPFTACGWGNPLVKGQDRFYDVANMFLFDWMQMSILGAVTQLVIIFFAIKLPLDNARRMPVHTFLSFINLAALGIICARFMHGMLDTFWIGRGCNLACWMAIGISVYVKLMLDQKEAVALSRRAEQVQSKPTRLAA